MSGCLDERIHETRLNDWIPPAPPALPLPINSCCRHSDRSFSLIQKELKRFLYHVLVPLNPAFYIIPTGRRRRFQHLSSPPPPYSTPGPLEPLSKTLTKCISKLTLGTFPSGTVAMTPSSQCRRPQVRSLVLQPRVHMTWRKSPPASTKTQYRQIHNKMKK